MPTHNPEVQMQKRMTCQNSTCLSEQMVQEPLAYTFFQFQPVWDPLMLLLHVYKFFYLVSVFLVNFYKGYHNWNPHILQNDWTHDSPSSHSISGTSNLFSKSFHFSISILPFTVSCFSFMDLNQMTKAHSTSGLVMMQGCFNDRAKGLEFIHSLSSGHCFILHESVDWVNFRELFFRKEKWSITHSKLEIGWALIKAKTVSQPWRIRLLCCFVAALLAEVLVSSFACFSFGPGLWAYGAGLSWGFQTHSIGMKDKASKNCKIFIR